SSERSSADAFKDGLTAAYFHWGLHVWAMYGMIALALAFFQFRKDEPGLISATLKPICGDKMNGPLGVIIDVLAVFATVFGVATSPGFGAVQINGGLTHLFGIEIGFTAQSFMITAVTILFLVFAWSGLSNGVKYVSTAHVVLSVILLIIVLVVGPTLLFFNLFTETFGFDILDFFNMSFRTGPRDGGSRGWLDAWTRFDWAWWIP